MDGQRWITWGWTVGLTGAVAAGMVWVPVVLLVAAVTAGIAVAVGAYLGWWLARSAALLRRAREAEYRLALLEDEHDRLAEQQVRFELEASTRAETPGSKPQREVRW